MIIVGERLNSTRKNIFNALEKKDKTTIIQEAQNQEHAGASYLDLNTAAMIDKENEALSWAIPLIQKSVKIPISIDTPNPSVMEHGLRIHKGQAIMNSMSGEKKKIDNFLPLAKKYRPKTIILCLDDSGLPKTTCDELRVAEKMVELMLRHGIDMEDIFLDPLVRTIGADQKAACFFLDALEKIKKAIPHVKTIAGISNISYGLPRRSILNRTLLSFSIEKGLDAAIIDPTDRDIGRSIKASNAILGKDPHLRGYIAAVKSKSI